MWSDTVGISSQTSEIVWVQLVRFTLYCGRLSVQYHYVLKKKVHTLILNALLPKVLSIL